MLFVHSVIHYPLRMRQISIAAKIVYDLPTDFPTELQDTPEAKNFCKRIRKYNNLFAFFASTKITPAKDLPVTKFGTGLIRISGKIFHKTGNLYTSAD